MLIEDIPNDDFVLADESIVNTLFEAVGSLDSPLFSEGADCGLGSGVFSKPAAPAEVPPQEIMYSHASATKVMPPVADLDEVRACWAGVGESLEGNEVPHIVLVTKFVPHTNIFSLHPISYPSYPHSPSQHPQPPQ
jgi:hypothetical protein